MFYTIREFKLMGASLFRLINPTFSKNRLHNLADNVNQEFIV